MIKKIIYSLCSLFIIIIIVTIIIINQPKDKLKTINLAEVTHSVFYAPQYLADKLGYYEEENLKVNIITTPGADKVTSAVLSGDVDIGFCGSEATIYVYNQGEKDYLINFAALTKKDGSFLVSRKKYKNFKIENLKGKHIIAGRKGGMPAMTLEYAINKQGVKTSDVDFDTSIDFAATTGAFIGGNGDFVALFEPSALQLEKQNYGYVVASVGELGGNVPYTTYNARKSYIEKNPKIIKGFTKATDRALKYIHTHNEKEIAKEISNYFPDISMSDLTKIVKRYMDIDAWFETTYITNKDFNHIQKIIKNAGELNKNVPYKKLVTTKFSKK